MQFIAADNIELFCLLSDRESPYKKISAFLLTDKDSKSATKVFTARDVAGVPQV